MEKKEMRRIVQNLYEEAEENLIEVALRSTIKNDPNITRRRKELAEGAALIEELEKPTPKETVEKALKRMMAYPREEPVAQGALEALALLAEDKPSVPMAMLTPLVNGNIWTSEDIRVHVESFGYTVKE